MAVLSHTVLGSHRRVFRNLVALWLLLFGATLLVALVAMPFKRAQAMEPLPFPKLAREIVAPEFAEFSSTMSQVPPQGMVADRCQSFLKSVRQNTVQDTRSDTATSYPTRRPAGSNVQMVKIEAIKAYRQCKSQSALQELAVWRWSR